MPKPWELVVSERLARVRVFDLRGDWAISPRTGAVSRFTILETRDWVNVVPLTDEGQVVMVRQWRHGARSVTLEIPGGVVDRDEEPARAAARELREETGYRARSIEPLGWVYPNPAVQTNRCFSFLARGCRRVGEPTPDEREDLETILVPLAEIPARIARGDVSHALVVVAFYRLGAAVRSPLHLRPAPPSPRQARASPRSSRRRRRRPGRP